MKKPYVVWSVLLSGAVVCVGHIFFSDAAEPLLSVKMGVAGAIGALVFDISKTLIEWHSASKRHH